MRKGLGQTWRWLGRMEQVFLILLALFAMLYFLRASLLIELPLALALFLLGLICAFRLALRLVRKAIWRLRNRLIAAYLFIAVVPVVLILTLVGIAAWAVIGQMAVYLVNTELSHRETNLYRSAVGLAHYPPTEPGTALERTAQFTRLAFPEFELYMSGKHELRYPPDAGLTHPPSTWKRGTGLILKKEAGGKARLYAWAHVVDNGEEVTILAPITQDLLGGLVGGLGDVNFVPLQSPIQVVVPGRTHQSRVPPAQNVLDFQLTGFYPVVIASWDSPDDKQDLVLEVTTRISGVLGTVFQNTVFQRVNWAETALWAFGVVTVLFFLVEIASLVAGVHLSRSITGAVHELYEGTQHIKDGDFSYRIPVKGDDQLAELGSSFNTMTGNLGRLIIVAKEKERLESELEIAREVQNQLFPKDVPFTKTLELKGVCHPARMVSGDYYDFMALPNDSLAFAIGDVAGKGISAALLMATIQSTMRTQISTANGNWAHHLDRKSVV